MSSKSRICLWYDGDALNAATFYAGTFPDSAIGAVHHAPGDYPGGKQGDILTVEFTATGIPCLAGTMIQEIYHTHPGIREACAASIIAHATQVEADIAAAMKRYRIRATGPPRAWRCIRKRFCKVPSSWRRPRVARPSRPRASTTCAATSSCCSNPQPTREKETS